MQLRQESLAGGTGPHTSWRNRSLGGTGVPIPLREAHLRTGRDIHTNPSSVVALRIKEAAAPIGRILVCRRRCPVVATHRIGRENASSSSPIYLASAPPAGTPNHSGPTWDAAGVGFVGCLSELLAPPGRAGWAGSPVWLRTAVPAVVKPSYDLGSTG